MGLNLIHRSPGDTVQYNINGQLMNVVIPENLKAGDTFEVSVPVAIPTVAAIPAAPPPPWRRYFVSSVTPGWFWFSVFWQALWALVRLLIANIVAFQRPVLRETSSAM